MADEPETTPTPTGDPAPAAPPAPPQPPAAPPTPVFTEADVQRIAAEAAKKAHDAAYAEARRTFQGKDKPGKDKPTPRQETSQPDPTPQPEPSGIDHRKLRVFDRATARLNLSDRAISRMESAFEADNPDDVASWVTDYVADMGLKPVSTAAPVETPSQSHPPSTPNQQQNQAPANQPAPNAQPVPKPIPTAAPQQTTPFVDGPQDPTKWTPQQMADYIAREGGDPRDLGSPKNAAIWRKIGDLHRAVGATRQLVMGRR